jgi:hypothetical protein
MKRRDRRKCFHHGILGALFAVLLTEVYRMVGPIYQPLKAGGQDLLRNLTAIDVQGKLDDGADFDDVLRAQTRIMAQRTTFQQSNLFRGLLLLKGSQENVRIYFVVHLSRGDGFVMLPGNGDEEKRPRTPKNDRKSCEFES